MLPQAAAHLFPRLAGTFDVNRRGPLEPPLPPRSPQELAPFSELRYLRPVMVICIKGDLDDDVPDLINVNGYLSPDTMPHTFEPIPYRPADEFASQAAQAQRHFHQRPTAGDGYTFNTVSRSTYLSLAYGANRVPAEHPIEYTATSILYICADHDLRMARRSNITYPGTYLVVSQEPGPPEAVPHPPRTRSRTLLATHSDRIDVLRQIRHLHNSPHLLRRAVPLPVHGPETWLTYYRRNYAEYIRATAELNVFLPVINDENTPPPLRPLVIRPSTRRTLAVLPQDTDMLGAVHHLPLDTASGNPLAMLPQDAHTIVGLPDVAWSFGDFLALLSSPY